MKYTQIDSSKSPLRNTRISLQETLKIFNGWNKHDSDNFIIWWSQVDEAISGNPQLCYGQDMYQVVCSMHKNKFG